MIELETWLQYLGLLGLRHKMQTRPSGLKLGLDEFEGSRQKTFPIPDAGIRGLASCLFTKMAKVVAKHWTRWAFYRKK